MNRGEAAGYAVKISFVLTAIAASWWLFHYSPRLIAVPFFVLAVIATSFWVFGKKIKLALGLWLAFILASFSPIELSLLNKPGFPHIVPILMGYPTPEAKKAADRGELFLGGCLVNGHEPKWVIIW